MCGALYLFFRDPLQGCYVFVGVFFDVSKPPYSLKPDAQHENFCSVWQNTKAKENVLDNPDNPNNRLCYQLHLRKSGTTTRKLLGLFLHGCS